MSLGPCVPQPHSSSTKPSMNFSIGRDTKLGNLNDIYGNGMTEGRAKFLPCKRYGECFAGSVQSSKTPASDLEMLVHYQAHGLVILNPSSVSGAGFTAAVETDAHVQSSWQSIISLLRSTAVSSKQVIDGSFGAQRKGGDANSAADQQQQQHTNAQGRELLYEDYGDFVVVPRFLSLAMFGEKETFEPHTPPYICSIRARGIINDRLRTMANEQEDKRPQQSTTDGDILEYQMCRIVGTQHRAPRPWDVRKAMQELLPVVATAETPAILGARFITAPLSCNLLLRKSAVDQLAIVASVIVQYRHAIGHHATSGKTSTTSTTFQPHLAGGVVILPCGIGKTNIAIASWLSMSDPIFSPLSSNDFGTMVYDDATTSAAVATPTASVSAFGFTNKSKSSASSGSYQAWLQSSNTNNKNPHDRSSAGPLAAPRLLWVVKGLALVSQSMDRIRQVVPGVKCGKLQASSRPNPVDHDVVVASLDTLCEQNDFPDDYFDHFGLVVIDEAHQCLSTFYRSVFAKIGRIPLSLMLTATPRNQELRWFGGPILVTAMRPFVEQEHVLILRSNINPANRKQVDRRIFDRGNNAGAGANGSAKKSPDIVQMGQMLSFDMDRNDFCVRTMIDVLLNADKPTALTLARGGYKLFEVERVAGASVYEPWSQFCNVIYKHWKGGQAPTKEEPNFSPPAADIWAHFVAESRRNSHVASFSSLIPRLHISSEYNAAAKPRVPIVFVQYVPHAIILQHMFAQQYMAAYAERECFSPDHLQLIRVGFRKLAVIDRRVLADHPDISAMIAPLDNDHESVAETCGGDYRGTLDFRRPNGDFNLDADFFRRWFSLYPPSEEYCATHKLRSPFKTIKMRRKAAKAVPKNPLTTPDAPRLKPQKKQQGTTWDPSSWMSYAQYFWTPLYGQLPTLTPARLSKSTSTKTNVSVDEQDPPQATPSKKRKRKDSEDELTGAPNPDVGGATVAAFNDSRPDLFAIPNLVVATFGLVLGSQVTPVPKMLLYGREGVGTGYNVAHFQESLHCDYIFANYGTASTGLDHDAIDTTIDILPMGSDDEQRKGRGMREAEDKQSTLHMQFGEPYGYYVTTSKKHITSFQKQGIASRLYIADCPTR